MKIHRISIKNILGIEALDFVPGAITRITGGNGVGKTSVLEAIKSICKGGYDATLLRTGQTKGEIVLELDGGVEVSKRITEKGAYLNVTKDGAKVDKPAEWVKALWDSLSANPVEFMLADRRKRIDWMLEQLDPAPVMQALSKIAPGIAGDNALSAMEAARKSIYDARTDANRTEKRARETAETLAADLPAEPEDIGKTLEAAQIEHQGHLAALRAAIDRVREERQIALRKIDEVEEEDIDAIRLKAREVTRKRSEVADGEAATIRVEVQPKIDAAAANVARLQEAQRTADEAVGRRKLLASTTAEAKAAKEQAEALTSKLAELDDLKAAVLDKLPIPGVSVVDGDIHSDGVPFDRLNTASQWQIAIAIAKMRAGAIPLICADGLEALDDTNFDAFASMAEGSGLHFIVTDRGNGPLAVDAGGKRVAA